MTPRTESVRNRLLNSELVCTGQCGMAHHEPMMADSCNVESMLKFVESEISLKKEEIINAIRQKIRIESEVAITKPGAYIKALNDMLEIISLIKQKDGNTK